jgi:PAS domain S-box-containing protein
MSVNDEHVSDHGRLPETELQMANAFERAAIGMAFVRPDGRFWHVNNTFAHMVGYTPQELEEKTFRDITHPDDQSIGDTALRKMIAGDIEAEVMEKRYLHKHGHLVPVRLTTTAIRDSQGQVSYLFTQAEDITERVAAKERVQQVVAELQRSNAELEQFAYIASHDLREPLRKVLAFGDRLKARYADVLDERGLDYLERMQGASTRMQRMIEDLLSFSRVATHAKPFERTDLTEVAHEAFMDLEIAASQSGARVEIEVLPEAEVDAAQVRLLLQNLLQNSIKFSLDGELPQIRVSGSVIEMDGSPVVELCVQDSGIGFDEKYLERIFLPFHRLHGVGKYEGSGIGLAVCRKIAERHGGSITAVSKPSEGATFIVRLPQWQATSTDAVED